MVSWRGCGCLLSLYTGFERAGRPVHSIERVNKLDSKCLGMPPQQAAGGKLAAELFKMLPAAELLCRLNPCCTSKACQPLPSA